MKLLRFFTARPDGRAGPPVDPCTAAARTLNAARHSKERARIHARCDEIAAMLGRPAVDWERLG